MMSVVPYSYFKRYVSNLHKKTNIDYGVSPEIYAVYLKIYTNIEMICEKRR
jgi:hypothetical protein